MKDKNIEEIFTIQDLATFIKQAFEQFKDEMLDSVQKEEEVKQHTKLSLENGILAAYKAREFLGCRMNELKEKTYYPNEGEEPSYQSPIPGYIRGNGRNKRVYYQIKDLEKHKRIEVLKKSDPQKYRKESVS